MRYGSTARRMRNGSNNNAGSNRGGGHPQQRRGVQNKNKVFDSNGPDVRIRGTAYQIVEKYQALAKDAGSAGDRVLAENYLQYAEHYQRTINSWEEEDAYYDSIDLQNADERQNNVSQGSGAEDEVSTPAPQRTQRQGLPRSSRTTSPRQDQNGDLGLPASILGRTPTAKTLDSAVAADNAAEILEA